MPSETPPPAPGAQRWSEQRCSKKVEVRQEGKRVRVMPTQVEGQYKCMLVWLVCRGRVVVSVGARMIRSLTATHTMCHFLDTHRVDMPAPLGSRRGHVIGFISSPGNYGAGSDPRPPPRVKRMTTRELSSGSSFHHVTCPSFCPLPIPSYWKV